MIIVARHGAISRGGGYSSIPQCVPAEALPSIFDTRVEIANASLETAGGCKIGVRLHAQCSASRCFGIAADAGKACRARIEEWTSIIGLIAIPSCDVSEQRDIEATAADTVAAANLVDIACTSEVAIAFCNNRLRTIIAAPAFLCILRPGKGIASSCACCDAVLVCVVRTRIQVHLKLAAWIVLHVASAIPIDRLLRHVVQGSRLLTHGITRELDVLLAEVGVVHIQCPLGCASIGVDVDLALWSRAI